MSRSTSPPHDDDFDDDEFSEPRRAGGSPKLKQLLLELVGRWHWIALGLILGVLGAVYYLSKAPKLYTATATLLVKQQTGSAFGGSVQSEGIDMRTQEAMNTVAEGIRRLDLMERVAARPDVRELKGLVPPEVDWTPHWWREKFGKPHVEAVSAEAPAPPPPVLGGMIAGTVGVEIRRGTRLLDVSVSHPVPEICKVLADAVIKEYLVETAGVREEELKGSVGVLSKQSEEASVRIQKATGSLAAYSLALQLQEKLDVKDEEVTRLRARYLRRHPKMIAAEAELKGLQDNFIREFNAARESSVDKDHWAKAGKDLPSAIDQPVEFVRAAKRLLIERMGGLQSEIKTSEAFLARMRAELDNSEVKEPLREAPAEIHELSRVPGVPSEPIANKVYGAGGVGGLAAGLLVAFLLVRIDNKYHTVAQLTGETQQTVLAAIADINPSHLAAAEKKHLKRHPEDAHDLHEDWDEHLVFRPGTSHTSYAEMFRVLRASISLLGDETKRKVTLFSSALPGEGKTSTSANFALAAACQGRKTLLIDLDLRKPSVHRMFGLPREQEKGGITECLANLARYEDVILRETGQENLHLILSGKRAPNPGELLDTVRLKAILAQACRDYDVVVLDTAPLLAVPDTRIVAPLVDNVCLVVRAEYVPKGAVARVLDVIEEDGTKLSGIVFNGFKEKRRLMGQNYSYGAYKFSKHGSAYKYGYGSYGTYGAYGSDDEEDDKPKRNRRKRKK